MSKEREQAEALLEGETDTPVTAPTSEQTTEALAGS